jgi:hypothetical protein
MVAVSVDFTVSKPKAGNLCFGCEVEFLVRTPIGNNVLSFGVPLLRVHDEPPDPGESMVLKQDFGKSVQNYSIAVVCDAPNHGKKKDLGLCGLLSFRLQGHVGIHCTLGIFANLEKRDVVMCTQQQRCYILVQSGLRDNFEETHDDLEAKENAGNLPDARLACSAALKGQGGHQHILPAHDYQAQRRVLEDQVLLIQPLAMPEVNSFLEKHLASHGDQTTHSNGRDIVAHGKPAKRSTSKWGKTRTLFAYSAMENEDGNQMEGLADTEATSHGAAGKLTGSHEAPRQE